MASSELVLAPQVDRNALKRSEMQIAASMEAAGKKASISMQRDVKKGISKGVKSGVNDGVSGSKGKFKALGLGVAVAAAAVIADTMDKTLNSLEDNIDRILGKLDTIKEVSSDAEAFGISKERYAAMSVIGASQGLDLSDLSGIMTGFSASLSDERMSEFKSIRDKQGMEKAFFDFLSSTGKLSESDRQQQLISVFGEDDMRLVSRILNPMMQLQNSGQELSLGSLFKQTTGSNLDLNAIASGMSQSEQAAKLRNKQIAQDQLRNFTSPVTAGQVQGIGAVAASQRNVEAAQMSAMSLQIKAKIVADTMTIKQIEAGVITGNMVVNFAESISKAIDNPTKENIKAVMTGGDPNREIVAGMQPSDPMYQAFVDGNKKIADAMESILEFLSRSEANADTRSYRGY